MELFMGYPDKDLTRVRTLYKRLSDPHWMARPLEWFWAGPDGRPQGFAPLTYSNPGLANLLWLSLDMGSSPQCYDVNRNGLYMLLLLIGHSAQLDGEPLLDLASVLTLREFAARLPATASSGLGAESAYPLLKMLAERRLAHADT
jgi:hypothetical protein